MTTPSATVQKLLREVEFRKTTYIQPHEYILREWGEPHARLYAVIALLLRARGYRQTFLDGKTYRYVNLGPYRYWIIKNVLNRQPIDTY